VTQHPKQWFKTVTWESVLNLNRALCQSQKLEALTDAKGLAPARALWEKAFPKSMLLQDALDICHDAFALGPFVFNNGNTFASIGRALVEEQLKAAPPVEAQILRTTIGHYIADKCGRREMVEVLEQLGPVLSKAAAAAATVTPTPSPAPAPSPTPIPAPIPAPTATANASAHSTGLGQAPEPAPEPIVVPLPQEQRA
jgi:hypothetical protein